MHIRVSEHLSAARWVLVGAAALLAACSQEPQPYDVAEVSLAQISTDLAEGRITSKSLTQAYMDRIQTFDDALQSVIAIAPDALEQAAAADARRENGETRGPLDGVPILIKDNIDLAGMPNTAGSLALAENIPANDAPMIARLKNAGAVILGKTNLSEWANFRSSNSSSGWSAVGGLARNPYNTDYSACGSSSGSGVAAAVSFAAATIGTETDGSVTCPASVNGLVGLKPTVGLVSRTGIIPIAASQDTAGPMARTVTDAAMLLNGMAGNDAEDPATHEANAHLTDYTRGLNAEALNGVRLAVWVPSRDYDEQTVAAFDAALEVLSGQGAELIEFVYEPSDDESNYEMLVLLTEFKDGIKAYLSNAPQAVQPRSLADLIAFNASEPRELEHFGQELFEAAQETGGLADPEYVKARADLKRLAGPEGIDRLLAANNAVAIVTPTTGPAWPITLGDGDSYGASATQLPATSGYPHLTVPMGLAGGLPVGLSFIGPAWSESLLLSLGYAYEQAANARVPPPALSKSE